jgi:hypothetical protein
MVLTPQLPVPPEHGGDTPSSLHEHQLQVENTPRVHQKPTRVPKVPNKTTWTKVHNSKGKNTAVHQPSTKPKQKARLPDSTTTVPKQQRYEINDYHNIVGHVNEAYLRATAKHYGIQLHGTLKPCIPCTLAKVHATPISKQHVPRSTTPGDRIFIDIYLHFPMQVSQVTNTGC